MTRELRCRGNKLHGLIVDEDDPKPRGTIEFRCDSHWCGSQPGVIVLHRFDLGTGEIHTRQYQDPSRLIERKLHGPSNQQPAVRAP